MVSLDGHDASPRVEASNLKSTGTHVHGGGGDDDYDGDDDDDVPYNDGVLAGGYL